MKSWTGQWLIMTAIILLMTSFVFFGEPLRQLVTSGNIANSATNIKLTGLFFAFGIILLIAGVGTTKR